MSENTADIGLAASIKAPPLKEGQASTEQARVFAEVREVLGPFEEQYHNQVTLILAKVKDGSVRKTPLKPIYAMRVQLASGGEAEATIETDKHKGHELVRKYVIDGNTVYFDQAGNVQRIDLGGLRNRKYKPPRLPEVAALRGKILDYNASLVHTHEYDPIVITTGDPTKMGFTIPHDERGSTRLAATVQQDGNLREHKGYNYRLKTYMGPNFPKLVGDALNILNPVKN